MREPLYRHIADTIAKQIADGIYLAGDRLLSIRRASEQFGASTATMQLAYAELERRRLARAHPQSGYYVLPPHPEYEPRDPPTDAGDLAEPVTVNQGVFQLLSRQRTDGFLNLGPAYVHPDFLPVAQLQRILRKLTRLHLENILTPDGTIDMDLGLRRQLAQRMLDAGCEIGSDEVITTAGCKDALALCVGAIVHQRGDIVAVETPTFPGILQLLEALGAKALEIPTDPVGGISIEALELALSQWPIKACVLVPTGHNPMGFIMPQERRRRLIDLTRSARVPVIEDDIFGDLCACLPRPTALKAYDSDGLVLYCSSISKSLGGGLRVGWACPGRYIEEVRRLKALHGVAQNALPAMVVSEFLAGRGYERHMRRLVRRIRHTLREMVNEIHITFPEGTAVQMPAAGYVVWVQLPGKIDSWALYKLALAQGIGILPGRLFAATERYNSCLRLSAALPWSPRVKEAIRCLGSLAASLLSARPGEFARASKGHPEFGSTDSDCSS